MFAKFQAVFDRSLHDYWINNIRGLDTEKLDRDVVRSGSQSFIHAVRDKFGKEGLTVVKRLTLGTAARKKS